MFAKFHQDTNKNNQSDKPNNNNKKESKEKIDNKESESKNEDDFSKIIKEIPLNNLNDYYDIETNLFKKRIEKLNLKFYWIYESVLGEEANNSLLYPYNKLFLILFKEISLYIEEIVRLNKQLTLKNKNEKYYNQKLEEYKLKEKDFLQSKHIIKNLERNIKNLEKNNEKLNNDIEKMNKKLYISNTSTNNSNSHFSIWRGSLSNSNKFKNFNNKKNEKIYNGILSEQGSIMSSGSNYQKNQAFIKKRNKSKDTVSNINSNRVLSTSSIYTKTTNISSGNNNKDIIFIGINQCEDEINNLNLIENILMKCYENNNKKKILKKKYFQSYKRLSPETLDINNNNQGKLNSHKKGLLKHKTKNTNKSIDYKGTNVINTNKI